MEQRLQTPEQQQWLPKFLGFDFTIQCKLGKENILANALSRSFMMAWSAPCNQWLTKVAELTQIDDKLKQLHDQCLVATLPSQNYAVKDGVVFWKGRVMLPDNEDIINQVLYELHASKIGGHDGCPRLWHVFCLNFFVQEYESKLESMCENVKFVNKPKLSMHDLRGYYNHCPFHNMFGKIFHWTSSVIYQSLMGSLLSW